VKKTTDEEGGLSQQIGKNRKVAPLYSLLFFFAKKHISINFGLYKSLTMQKKITMLFF
jgi:hypothetical protein